MHSASIIYGHDGQVVQAEWKGNAHTLLQHLREERRLTGTKEGCAEGDCGACLVLLGESAPSRDGVRWRSVNACFLPLSAVHGRLLATVESIGCPSALHPVQAAMVEEHASQCGFCTPGFVVSLYEHYLRHPQPTPVEQVHRQLSGNLCRCTGYAPILRAARSMYRLPRIARDAAADASLLQRVRTLVDAAPRVLESHGETVMFPASSDELAAQRQAHPEAVLLGGGTDVGLWVTKQLRALPKVIHLAGVGDMRGVVRTGHGLRIGAALPLEDAAEALARDFPELAELWQRFASPPVRHVATLGGNIANGSPIGDSMPVLMAIGARLLLRGAAGRRAMAIEDFYLGYQRTALRPDEFIEAIDVPARGDNLFVRAYKVSKRRDDDISAVSMALALRLDGDGRVAAARIALGGMAATPRRARGVETALHGRTLGAEAMMASAAALADDFTPLSDHRASAGYRMRVAGNLLLRAALEFEGTERARLECREGAAP
ncbi:xanthine dehydrogenase small subunit [Xenophilus azovorans]|uniref:xanthine dehydrogenase small subunit n=1 Tax=Xenophilus azovorans TaxID=151755 RepID=UPI00056EC26B|nr:xanthine dehydrogenase small subunit [Xenophilus azovorans]